MNKKILSALIFTSLFVISTVAVFAQPVAGASFKFGVPKEAKGMKLQAEVKIYDKDTWGDCLGVSPDRGVNWKFGGDGTSSNNVGAKSQTEIQDWEKDDIWFFGDHLMHSDVDINSLGLTDYWSAADFVYDTQYGIMVGMENSFVTGLTPLLNVVLDPLSANASALTGIGSAIATMAGLTQDVAEISAKWSKTYDGVIVEADVWDFSQESFESNPDERDKELPFIEDPHNVYDSYLYFNTFMSDAFNLGDLIVYQAAVINGTCKAFLSAPFNAIVPIYANAVATGVLNGYLTNPAVPTMVKSLITNMMALYTYRPTAIFNVIANLNALITAYFRRSLPSEKSYLVSLLESGLPAHQDVNKWWSTVLDDFDLDKDEIYGDGPSDAVLNAFGFATYDDRQQGGIEIDGLVITVEVDWLDTVWRDPTSIELDERKDYDIIFTYSDTGGQSSVEYVKGDEVFYKKESLSPTIAGFEISILLGAAAISALGLIFIVMKKRRM